MKRVIAKFIVVCSFFASELACSDAWVDAFANGFADCKFSVFKAASLDGNYHSIESYLEGENIKPYKVEDGFAFVKVDYAYFGLHVSEVIVPIGSYYFFCNVCG